MGFCIEVVWQPNGKILKDKNYDVAAHTIDHDVVFVTTLQRV